MNNLNLNVIILKGNLGKIFLYFKNKDILMLKSFRLGLEPSASIYVYDILMKRALICGKIHRMDISKTNLQLKSLISLTSKYSF